MLNNVMKTAVAAIVSLVALPLLLGGCGEPSGTQTDPGKPSLSPQESTSPSEQPAPFPAAAFANIDGHRLPEVMAAELQAILAEAAGGHGVTATVMSASGTWTGTVGHADQQHRMRPDAQMAIGSITKTIIAAQTMQLVETGELSLDDPVADHLPASVNLDTNQATIRHLLSMRSGIPDFVPANWDSPSRDRRHRWTTGEVLELVGDSRTPPGDTWEYSSTNYVLLGLVIEHVRGRPLSEVLRAGVLAAEGLDRLVFQPDERPSQPMAMPFEETAALEKGGGFLPDLASVSGAGAAGAIASDSASLARWWAGFCGGQIVSQASLDEMTAFLTEYDEYGLGLMSRDAWSRPNIGHGGVQVGFTSWATCLPSDGLVIAVLSNEQDFDTGGVAESLAIAAAEWE